MRNQFHYLYRIFRTSFTPLKMWNACRLALSYRLSAFGILTRWKVKPRFISIEPVNACNLRCPECPVGMRETAVKAIHADLPLIKKLIDELAPTLMYTTLYFQGEPLLNRNFTEIVQYVRSKNILTATSTNSQLIDDNLAKSLVLSGLDRLIISVDGATQDTYEVYRVGGKLQKVIDAIYSLVKWKKELKSASPYIEVQFLVLKTNEHQLDEMKRLAKEWNVDKLTFKSAQLYDFENGHELIPITKKYARYELRADGKYHIKKFLRNRCKRLWEGAVITSTADVLPCCFDKDSRYVFGNLNENFFAECWHSENAMQFRKKLLENRKQFEMCRNCTSP